MKIGVWKKKKKKNGNDNFFLYHDRFAIFFFFFQFYFQLTECWNAHRSLYTSVNFTSMINIKSAKFQSNKIYPAHEHISCQAQGLYARRNPFLVLSRKASEINSFQEWVGYTKKRREEIERLRTPFNHRTTASLFVFGEGSDFFWTPMLNPFRETVVETVISLSIYVCFFSFLSYNMDRHSRHVSFFFRPSDELLRSCLAK